MHRRCEMPGWVRKDGSSGSFVAQKGYARLPSSGAVIGIGRSVNPQQFEWDDSREDDDGFWEIALRTRTPKHIVIERPLVVIPIYDGDSYDLEEFFHRQIQDLDRASGQLLHFLEIGHPGQSGPVMRNLLKQLYGDKWDAQERCYVQRVFRRGIEHDHRREAMSELRERLQIPVGLVPCLAVPLPLEGARAVVLPIQRPWFKSDDGRLALSWSLREWLGSPALTNLLHSSGTAVDLAQRLPTEFRNLEFRLTKIVREIERGSGSSATVSGIGWAPSAEGAVLSMERPASKVTLRDRPVVLTAMEFKLLWTLALRSEERLPYESLQREASGLANTMLTSTSDWARTHKFHLLKKLRLAVGGSLKTRKELANLIVSNRGTMMLNLRRSQIHLEF
jgi:hypothetical protein